MTVDAYTDSWREIAAKCNEIIEQSRSRLETNDQSYGDSQFCRGRISAVREVLDMVRPAIVTTANKAFELRPKDRSGI